jgi:hypothetical protein
MLRPNSGLKNTWTFCRQTTTFQNGTSRYPQTIGAMNEGEWTFLFISLLLPIDMALGDVLPTAIQPRLRF